MKTFLIVFEYDPDLPEHRQFLADVAAYGNKLEGVEWLLENVCMIPEGEFLPFSLHISVLLNHERSKKRKLCGITHLSFSEPSRLFRWKDFPL